MLSRAAPDSRPLFRNTTSSRSVTEIINNPYLLKLWGCVWKSFNAPPQPEFQKLVDVLFCLVSFFFFFTVFLDDNESG